MYKYNSGVLDKSLVLILPTHTPTLFDLCFHSSDLAFVSRVWYAPSDFGPLDVQPSGLCRTSSSRRPTFRVPLDFALSTSDPLDFLGLPSTLSSPLRFHLDPPLLCLAIRASHWSGQRVTVRSLTYLPDSTSSFLPLRHVRTPVGVRS